MVYRCADKVLTWSMQTPWYYCEEKGWWASYSVQWETGFPGAGENAERKHFCPPWSAVDQHLNTSSAVRAKDRCLVFPACDLHRSNMCGWRKTLYHLLLYHMAKPTLSLCVLSCAQLRATSSRTVHIVISIDYMPLGSSANFIIGC